MTNEPARGSEQLRRAAFNVLLAALGLFLAVKLVQAVWLPLVAIGCIAAAMYGAVAGQIVAATPSVAL